MTEKVKAFLENLEIKRRDEEQITDETVYELTNNKGDDEDE